MLNRACTCEGSPGACSSAAHNQCAVPAWQVRLPGLSSPSARATNGSGSHGAAVKAAYSSKGPEHQPAVQRDSQECAADGDTSAHDRSVSEQLVTGAVAEDSGSLQRRIERPHILHESLLDPSTMPSSSSNQELPRDHMLLIDQALRFEAQQGFCNAQGRKHAHFAAFMEATLRPMINGGPQASADTTSKLAHLEMRDYETASPQQRRTKVEQIRLHLFGDRGAGVVRHAPSPGLTPTTIPVAAPTTAPPAPWPPAPRHMRRHVARAVPIVATPHRTPPPLPPSQVQPAVMLSPAPPFVGTDLHARLAQVYISKAEQEEDGSVDQGDEEWHLARGARLTASAAAAATGLLPRFGAENHQRLRLWKEKLGLAPPFTGNAATKWGVENEQVALEYYERLTGNSVAHCAFDVCRGTDSGARSLEWLGASPDGLIMAPSSAHPELGRGILEIKCPHSRRDGPPWSRPADYYLPQLQMLMAVFDCSYAHLLCWTPNGVRIWQVQHSSRYWDELLVAMTEFWHQHVLPAKAALSLAKQGGLDPIIDQVDGMALIAPFAPPLRPSNYASLSAAHAEVISSIEIFHENVA